MRPVHGKAVLAVDAGGTYYKSALVDSCGGIIPGTFRECPSHSDAGRETVLRAFTGMIQDMTAIAAEEGRGISRIALAFPGPFDYRRGASMMDHKFVSIYDVPLKPLAAEAAGDPDMPVVFHYDLHASVYGAWLYDEGQSFNSVICVSLGTGLGGGYLRNGQIVMEADGGPKYLIYKQPYRGGILEDAASNRGLAEEYRRRTGCSDVLDAKELERRALLEGDRAALELYRDMGETLGRELRPLFEELGIDCLLLAGQISKGYRLFGPALEEALTGLPSLKKIGPLKDFAFTAIRGAAALPALV
ncbi:ROK family protein [Treponema sp. OttesenSCG-928-L16]|nr:ROK family protein [Treponema sp. OttesenSCG-928-L16]